MASRSVASIAFLSVFAGWLLALTLVPVADADTWPQWRGGNRQGSVPAETAPLYWSAGDNVVWSTPIPGEGHSSPIVTEDAIFVTTAREVPARSLALLVIGAVILAILGVIIGLSAVFLRERSSYSQSAGLWPRGYLRKVSTGALLGVSSLIVIFGEELFDFHRAEERAWVAVALFGTLLLAATGLVARFENRSGITAAWGLAGFAMALAVTVPEGLAAVVADPLSPRSGVVYAVVGLPLLIGLGLLAGALDKRPRLASAARWGIGFLVVGIVVPILVGAALQHSQGAHVVSVAELHEPVMRWWIVLALACMTAVLLWLARRGDPRSSTGAMAVAGGILTLIVIVVAIVEHAVVWWPYLGYHAGELKLEPDLGWPYIGLVVIGCIAAAVIGARRRPGDGARRTSGTPLQVAALVLPVLYLLWVLYIPRDPVFARGIVCLDRSDGQVRWEQMAVHGPQGNFHSDNSAATPTPVTDGKHVVAYFGTPGLLCTNVDGKVQWMDRSMPFESHEGVASSLILYDTRVIVLAESSSGGYLAAFDTTTGMQQWKIDRGKKVHSYAGNCRTPSIIETGGRPTLVVWGEEDLSGYDPETGEELWSHHPGSFGKGGNPVSSAISDADRIYLLGPRRSAALAIDRLATEKDPIVWDHVERSGAQCASPVLTNGLLFAVSDVGSAYCLDAATGKELWRQSLGTQHYASPTVVGGAVYYSDTRGKTTVVAAQAAYRELGTNDLPGGVYASAAPVDGRMYLRTVDHLYCLADIGAKRPAASASSPQQRADGSHKPRVTCTPVDLSNGQWAQFRGPFGMGLTTEPGCEPGWDAVEGRDLLWKMALPLPGWSSPIVWGKRLFVTSADETRQEVACFDTDSGKLLWRRPVPPSVRPDSVNVDPDTGYAASTPATDGRRVYATFATGDIACIDFEGRLLWSRKPGPPDNMYGHATSLLVYDGMVLVQYDQEPSDEPTSRLFALNALTGNTVWETPRDVPSSWATPLLVSAAGRTELITCANPWVIAYDPASGEELWRADCLRGDVAPSPTVAGGMIIVGNESSVCTAIRAGGTGDVTQTHVEWTYDGMLPDICSPTGTDEFVFLLSTYGFLTCLDSHNGEFLWEEQLDASFKASPIVAGERLYILSDDGRMYVLKLGGTYELVGEGLVGETCHATPAFHSGRMFIRTSEHIVCIGRD